MNILTHKKYFWNVVIKHFEQTFIKRFWNVQLVERNNDQSSTIQLYLSRTWSQNHKKCLGIFVLRNIFVLSHYWGAMLQSSWWKKISMPEYFLYAKRSVNEFWNIFMFWYIKNEGFWIRQTKQLHGAPNIIECKTVEIAI